MNGRLNRTVEKLQEKAYRDAYVEAHVKVGIPHQIRALREQEERKWSQAELGRRSGKPANVISRLEDPESGGNTIRTCLEMASAFDVALVVKFVSYSRFLQEFEDVSPKALEVPSFASDPGLTQTPKPDSNILNAVVEATLAGQAVYATVVGLQPGGNVYWTVYRPKEQNLTEKISDAGESYQFQEPLVPQHYSDKTLIGGLI